MIVEVIHLPIGIAVQMPFPVYSDKVIVTMTNNVKEILFVDRIIVSVTFQQPPAIGSQEQIAVQVVSIFCCLK